MFNTPRAAFSMLSLSTRLLIGSSFLSVGSAYAMDTQEVPGNEEQSSTVIPRAKASVKGKEEVEESDAESSTEVEPTYVYSSNTPIRDIVTDYLRSFGNTYEEFLTEKPIVVTADPGEEGADEWEASPPFLDIFLMRLGRANKTEDLFGLEEPVFATFSNLISLVENSLSAEKYAVFRYLVDLSGNQLIALHDRVAGNPEILLKIKQNVPGLWLYSSEEILSEAFTMNFLEPLTTVSPTFHDVSRQQKILGSIDVVHARRIKNDRGRTISLYVGTKAKYVSLFHAIAKAEGVSPESVKLISVDSWGENSEPLSIDEDWIRSIYGKIGSRDKDSVLFTVPKDTNYARRILYTIDGEEPTPVEAHAVLFTRDDIYHKEETIMFNADTARTLTVSCYSDTPLQIFMSNLDTKAYPNVDTVYVECDQFGLGLANAMAKYPRQHRDETPSSLMDRISGIFKELVAEQGWNRVVNFILRDSTTGLAVDMFRYHPGGTIEGIVSAEAATEFLSDEATPVLPLASYNVGKIEGIPGLINSETINFAVDDEDQAKDPFDIKRESFNFYYGSQESSKSIFERTAVMCGVEPEQLRICYLEDRITFPSYTEALGLSAVWEGVDEGFLSWFCNGIPPLLDDGSRKLDSNNTDIDMLLPELTRVKTKTGNAFYGNKESIPPVSQIILPENETLEEIIITIHDPKGLFNALSRFHRAHYPNVSHVFLDADLSGEYHDREYFPTWLRDAKEKNGWGPGTVFVVRDTKSGQAAEII